MLTSWRNALCFALASACALIPPAFGEAIGPDALVRTITDDVIAAIKQDSSIQAGDATKIAALVETKILPHFNSRRATQLAMGPSWRRATPQQQDRLTAEFQALLVRTYSGALAAYRDEVIDVIPLRAKPGDTEVTVRCRIKRPGGALITLAYSMEQGGGEWKIFDVAVDGVSLVVNYRSTFAEEVHNRGIEGLIERLSNKNRQASVNPAAPGN